MSRRVLESLQGFGDVYAGHVLLRRTQYDLKLWTDAQVDGHIDITGISEALVLAGADQLTLRLQDGRRLRFTLTDTGGAILAREGFQS